MVCTQLGSCGHSAPGSACRLQFYRSRLQGARGDSEGMGSNIPGNLCFEVFCCKTACHQMLFCSVLCRPRSRYQSTALLFLAPLCLCQGYYCTVREDQCTWDRTAQGTCDEDYFLMDGCSYTRPYINTVCTNSSHLQNSALSWGQVRAPSVHTSFLRGSNSTSRLKAWFACCTLVNGGYALQGYGMQSRCLEHDTSEVFVRRSQGYVEPPPLGCYEMACSYEGDRLFLKVSSIRVVLQATINFYSGTRFGALQCS